MPALTRRELLAASAATAAAAGSAAENKPTLCLFTKHLPHLGYKELAATLRSLGFAGADLTTRPRGHVLPENVERDLPAGIRSAGSRRDRAADDLHRAAVKQGLRGASYAVRRGQAGHPVLQARLLPLSIRRLRGPPRQHQERRGEPGSDRRPMPASPAASTITRARMSEARCGTTGGCCATRSPGRSASTSIRATRRSKAARRAGKSASTGCRIGSRWSPARTSTGRRAAASGAPACARWARGWSITRSSSSC